MGLLVDESTVSPETVPVQAAVSAPVVLRVMGLPTDNKKVPIVPSDV